MLEEIEEMMNSHPLVQGLREGGWVEKTYKPSQSRFLQSLSGTQGLTLRGFRMPESGYTILVFYTGSGLEGWPDVIHGGLITTLFNEAVHLQLNYEGGDWSSPYQMVVDFKESIRPNEIYSILLPPLSMEPVEQPQEGTLAQLAVHGMLMRMEMAPEITTEVDEVTQARTDTVSIPTRTADSTVFAQATYYTIVPAFATEEEAQAYEAAKRQQDEEEEES